MQEKLQREEEELKREKQRLVEERESQRLQRYVSPSEGSSGRPHHTDVNRYQPPPSAAAPDNKAPGRLAGNDQISVRQQSRESVVPGPPVSHERQKFAADDVRTRTAPADLPVPRPAGQYQQQQQQQQQLLQQQNSNQGRQNPTTYQHPASSPHLLSSSVPDLAETRPAGQHHHHHQQQGRQNPTTYQHPASSPHLLSSSVPPGSNLSPRQSGQPWPTGSRTPREDPADEPTRRFFPSLDRSDQLSPRSIPVDPRSASQPRGYPEPQETMYDPQRHWRQSSYEAADWRNGAGGYSRPEPTRTATLPSNVVDPYQGAHAARDQRGSYRSSTSSSQPDLLRYLDPAAVPRSPSSRLVMTDESYRPVSYQPYPPAPSHSRSASNPVTVRAQGGNASAVDSLFAYHQKSTPTPTQPTSPRSPSSSSYVPPAAAVQHISMQAHGLGSAPAKPPRLASAGPVPAAYPYDYSRPDNDLQDHAEYAQQVSTIVRVFKGVRQ